MALEEGAAPTRRVETLGKRLVTFEAVIELIVVVVDILMLGRRLRRWFQRDEIVGFCLRKILKDGRISSSRKRCSFETFKRGAKECHVACCTIERSWMKSTGS